ncbi:MAG TPA: hypothetical protein PKC39_08255 [Ferruginibacter sp.]|nr:hypothetical protein [Ferruginibacter sp.]HMP20934.1 hypothetical protein [Ferruginibacter sp.]
MLEGLHGMIQVLLAKPVQADDDKLHYAVLAEIKCLAEKRLIDVRKEYSISFTPAQAMALRILATDYITEKTSYIGNHLHAMSNQIHQLYQ